MSSRASNPEATTTAARVREARRVYRKFHARCFWSFDPAYCIESSDIAWVADQLRRHGGREAWELASKLCR